MKKVLSVFTVSLFLLATKAHADPILNDRVGVSGRIFPDSKEPDLFYILPEKLIVARNLEGLPQTVVRLYGKIKSDSFALVVLDLVPSLPSDPAFLQEKNSILQTQPNARFKLLPSDPQTSARLLSIVNKTMNCTMSSEFQSKCWIILNSLGYDILYKLSQAKPNDPIYTLMGNVPVLIRGVIKEDGKFKHFGIQSSLIYEITPSDFVELAPGLNK